MEINSWRIILTIETKTEQSYDAFGREKSRVVPNFRDGPVEAFLPNRILALEDYNS